MAPNSFQLSLKSAGSIALMIKDIQRAVLRELLLKHPDTIVSILTGQSSTTPLQPEGEKLRLVLEFQVITRPPKEKAPE